MGTLDFRLLTSGMTEGALFIGNSRQFQTPFRHSRTLPSRHSRNPLSFPAAPPVIPAVFSGNPVKTILIPRSIRESYPFDKASMTSE